MIDFKLASIKCYAKFANNKVSHHFILVTKEYLNRTWVMLHLLWCRKFQTGCCCCCCCFTLNTFKRACSKRSEATRETSPSKFGVKEMAVSQFRWNKLLLRILENYPWRCSFIIKQHACLLQLHYKTNYLFFSILRSTAEQHVCTRPLNGCLVTLQYHFWSQSQ